MRRKARGEGRISDIEYRISNIGEQWSVVGGQERLRSEAREVKG